jgi:hypothetical protein
VMLHRMAQNFTVKTPTAPYSITFRCKRSIDHALALGCPLRQ